MDELIGPLEILRVAHEGVCVARHEGRVIFVRGTLPGERVMARVTDDSKDSLWWADTEEVLEASEHRVEPPCAIASLCGGCDFQHVDPAYQLELKSQVLTDVMKRIGHLDIQVPVEAVGESNLGWRTRVRYALTPDGVAFRAARSNLLVEVPEEGCQIAHPMARMDAVGDVGQELEITVGTRGYAVIVDGQLVEGDEIVEEDCDDATYHVSADGFWQVHPAASQTLVDVVCEMADPQPGELAVDLYCGVGLFAGALSRRGMTVVGVESSRDAIALARHNVPEGVFHAARVEQCLRDLPEQADVIVLDPPRVGAREKVCRHVADMGASRIIYVACSPAALARDLGTLMDAGYRLEQIRAFDLFPMTYHFETVCLLTRVG